MSGYENISVEQPLKAIYEDGVFRPLEPVDLDEHQQVKLAVEIVVPDDRDTGHQAEDNLADLATLLSLIHI